VEKHTFRAALLHNEKLSRLKKAVVYSLLIGLLLFSYSINAIFVGTTLGSLHDFGSFIAAGQLAEAGKDPYSIHSPLVFNVTFKGINLVGDAPNLNPPISVLIFKQIASVDPFTSINIWRILSILLFIISIVILHRTYKLTGNKGVIRTVWVVAMAGFWHTIQLGQLYCLLLLLVVLTYVFLKKEQDILAGLMLGLLIAIKPNFVFWAFLLLGARRWKTFLTAGFTGLCVSLIPIPFYGVEIYSQWLEASRINTPALLLFPGNNSLQGLTARILHPEFGLIIGAFLSLATLWHVFKNRPAVTEINAYGIIISLLISPIAWTGYTLLTMPVFFEINKWNWKYYLSALMFAVPVHFILANFNASFTGFVFFGWFYGWGLLLLLTAVVFSSERRIVKKAESINSIQTN
jgi:hypothetical protein